MCGNDITYVLESNLHPFYCFRELKNQMWIRITCGLDSQSWDGFWKNDRAAVRAVRTMQYNNLLFSLLFIIYCVTYTGCPRRNVPEFGRVFLMLKYTDKTQNTYIQSWTVTEIMAREVWNFDSCYTLIDYQIHIKTGRNMLFL